VFLNLIMYVCNVILYFIEFIFVARIENPLENTFENYFVHLKN
jgi:hypothetical protein